jgi:hypothetical protein
LKKWLWTLLLLWILKRIWLLLYWWLKRINERFNK